MRIRFIRRCGEYGCGAVADLEDWQAARFISTGCAIAEGAAAPEPTPDPEPAEPVISQFMEQPDDS